MSSGSACSSRTALLSRVQPQFELHHLAIEDAEHAHQRPKIEQYGEALFIVARTAQLDGEGIAFGETHLFVGEAISSGSDTAPRPPMRLCASVGKAAHSLARGEDFILYAILDFIVDNYMPVLETIHDEVEAIEAKCSPAPMTRRRYERLYMLRRDLLRLRNAVGPLVDVCRRLSTTICRCRPAMQPLFRDVTDHVRTVQERSIRSRGAGLRL